MHPTTDVPVPGPQTAPALAAASVSLELASALTALGPRGERALGLLREAEAVLAGSQRHHAPYEVAPMCCRGALESLLGLAGRDQDFVGPVSTGHLEW
ncbi:hypothetical protein [Kitasatospora sp. NPDC056181]|uniref:hypothetical protein n=1 Tax=Kitasatospora sp. NPDC056181 TaxID=3345737 RepID=UPI0035D9B067